MARGGRARAAAAARSRPAGRRCCRRSRRSATRRGGARRGGAAADPASVTVVTGQQAGVFGGPMFTLLKAITALQLARRTERKQKVPAVAVFWVDAEDHDWEEVRSCTVLDAEFQPRTVTLADLEGAGELPIAQLQLDARVEQTIDELASVLQQTEFTSTVLDALRAAWKPGTGMARAFATWLETLLGPHGLVVFESADRGCEAAGRRRLRARARRARADGGAGGRSGRARSRRAATRRRSCRSPTACRSSVSTAAAGRSSRQGDQLVVGDATHTSDALSREAAARPERLQSERAAASDRAGHAVPHHLLRRGSERARVPGPAAWRLRAVRRTDAADVPAVDGDAARFRRGALPRQVRRAVRGSAHARRVGAQQAARVAAAGRGRAVAAGRGVSRRTTRWVASSRRCPSLDPTLQGAAKTTLGKMEHELRVAALEGDPRGEEARRDAAPAVHPRAGAGVPARPSAGAHARSRSIS